MGMKAEDADDSSDISSDSGQKVMTSSEVTGQTKAQNDCTHPNNEDIKPKEDMFEENIKLINGKPNYAQIKMLDNNDMTTPLRKRNISNTLDEGSSNVKQLPLIGDSWHSLSGYVTSMENISHSKSAPNLALKGTIQHSRPPSCVSIVKEILQNIKETMDFTMLQNPVFVIYGLSCIFCMAGTSGDPHYAVLWPVLNGISITRSPVEIPFRALFFEGIK